MRRSGSQSSASEYSTNGMEDDRFPSYEDLFYRPPSLLESGSDPVVLESRVRENENEGPLRALLEEMRDWYFEHSEEAERRLHKPLPPPPVESDDEYAMQKPFGPARVGARTMSHYPEEAEDDDSPTPMRSFSPLHVKSPTLSATSSRGGPATPTAFPVIRRPFADVPQTPTTDVFVDSPCPSPKLPQASLRARSSSMTLCSPSFLAVRSEYSLHQRRPPLLSSAASFGAERVLLQPGFNKSFSAPNTPTAGEFMQARPDRPTHLHHVHPSPYSSGSGHLMPGNLSSRAATLSRWSLSTAAQDDVPESAAPPSTPSPKGSKKGLTRSSSRLGLGISFAKFDLVKLMRFPSRSSSRKRLIVWGVKSGDERAVQCVRQWCEVFGAVDRLSRKANGEIHVHFRNRAVADRVCQAHTEVLIAGAGNVSLSYAGGSGRK